MHLVLGGLVCQHFIGDAMDPYGRCLDLAGRPDQLAEQDFLPCVDNGHFHHFVVVLQAGRLGVQNQDIITVQQC